MNINDTSAERLKFKNFLQLIAKTRNQCLSGDLYLLMRKEC